MKKGELHELLKYYGEIDTLVGMKDYTFNEGRAKGVRAIDMKNGRGMEMTVLADKCLDVSHLSYKGVNIGFPSKTGVTHPAYYVEDGWRGYLKTFNAGFLTTCGITYAGAACEADGRKYGLHGPISNTPAKNVNKSLAYFDDEVVLRVSGDMQESVVFEENMHMDREILLSTESNTFFINDTVKNLGFERQRLMNLYHINFGYPTLSEGARVYVSAKNMKPRDAEGEKGVDNWEKMEAPQIGYKEQCFVHEDEVPGEDSFAMLVSSDGKMAVVVHYDQNQCPVLCEWKCMAAGEYVLGLEPSACGFWGIEKAETMGIMKYAEPGAEYNFNIRVDITEDKAEIAEYIAKSSKK
jgi:hypothetical protein